MSHTLSYYVSSQPFTKLCIIRTYYKITLNFPHHINISWLLFLCSHSLHLGSSWKECVWITKNKLQTQKNV